MSGVSVFLLVVAAIFLIGIIGEVMFAKTGIPDVVWLIVVGIILGPVGGLVTHTQLEAIAPYFGALTLVVVLFDGGAELRIGELSKAAGRGTILALVGFILAVAVVTPVCYVGSAAGILPESWGWLQCLLVGTILGGSSSVVIMPALRQAGLSSKISNLVNYESALTDVLSVVSTGAVISIAVAAKATQPLIDAAGKAVVETATSSSEAGEAGIMLAKNFGIGVVGGLLGGLILVLSLRRLRKSQYTYPLILGSLLVLYVIVDEMGGSAALAILAAAVMVGNAPALSKRIGLAKTARLGSEIEGVHDEMTFIIKSFFFCFIGAMLRPPWSLLLFGFLIGLVLLVARLPNVALSTIKSGISTPAKGLISVLMPRGMAAGVLAMMPYEAGIAGTKDLPVVVFSAVFTTILLFATGFPLLKGRLPASDLAGGDEPTPETVDSMAPVASATDEAGLGAALHKTPELAANAAASGTGVAVAGVAVPQGVADETVVDPNAGPES